MRPVLKIVSEPAILEACSAEVASLNQALLIAQFLGDGAKMDRIMVPSKNNIDFLRYPVALAELNTWAIAMIGPINFGTKWSGGRARPKEIAWYIANHSGGASELISRGIPADIVTDVLAMNLTHAHQFTAYPEGCPAHPSWPAMHSAASVVSFWLPVVMNLTPEQILAKPRPLIGVFTFVVPLPVFTLRRTIRLD